MGKKVHVMMVVTNPFRPDERVRREAETLAGLGFDVTVLAWDRKAVYPVVENFSGFLVRRIRLRSMYSNLLSVLVMLPIFWAVAFVEMLTKDLDVIHCHDLDTLPVGIATKMIKRKVKMVYDAHEDYSSMIADFAPSAIRAAIAAIERLLPRKADAVLTVNEMLASRIQNRRVFVVRNSPDISRGPTRDSGVSGIEWPPGFRILFYGYLTRDRGIDTILRIASERQDVSVVIAGDGPSIGVVKQAALELRNLRFLGYISQEQIGRLLVECDLVYALEDPRIENNRIASPSRLFQAMMFGKPVLAPKDSYMAQVVLRERCGVLAAYDDLPEVLDAIVKLKGDRHLSDLLGKNGKMAFEKRYKWQFSARSLKECYDSILQPSTNDTINQRHELRR